MTIEFRIEPWHVRAEGAIPEAWAPLLLRGVLVEPAWRRTLRETAAGSAPATEIASWDDEEVLAELLSGPLALVSDSFARPEIRLPRMPAPAEAPAPPRSAAVDQEREDIGWIKFSVIDDETGEPVRGVALRLKLTNGRVEDHTTDRNGIIYLRGLPSGTCDIEKMTDQDALEVVAVE